MTPFAWTPRKEAAALSLAQGHTINEAAQAANVSEKSIDRWKKDIEFTQEVDRLSLMVGIASRAERLRIIQRVVRQAVRAERVVTEKDLLDWLKYAQSETDGAKLDLTNLFTSLSQAHALVAGGGSRGDGSGAGDSDEEAV
jgi:transposase-like protein